MCFLFFRTDKHKTQATAPQAQTDDWSPLKPVLTRGNKTLELADTTHHPVYMSCLTTFKQSTTSRKSQHTRLIEPTLYSIDA